MEDIHLLSESVLTVEEEEVELPKGYPISIKQEQDEYEFPANAAFEKVLIKEEAYTNSDDETFEQVVEEEPELITAADTSTGDVAEMMRSRFFNILGKQSTQHLLSNAALKAMCKSGIQVSGDDSQFIVPDKSAEKQDGIICTGVEEGGPVIVKIEEEKREMKLEDGCVAKGKRSGYFCSICDKEFQYHCRLIVHMRVHSGDKPFQCSMCESKFSCKGNLTKHIKLHTGDRYSRYVKKMNMQKLLRQLWK